MREAEAFIVSRPWVTYNIHMAENLIRFKRVPKELRTGIGRRDTPRGDQVRRRWEERGQWNDSWDEPGIKEQSIQPGWTWRDETPEPEPEPLDFLQFDTADFTKLEAAEWEAIPLPSLSTMKLPLDRVSTEPTTDLDTPWMAPFESTGSIAQSLECDNEKQDCEQSDDELESWVCGYYSREPGDSNIRIGVYLYNPGPKSPFRPHFVYTARGRAGSYYVRSNASGQSDRLACA